ncbi:solute carrier family 2, facilitated glucose transporter member 8-like isoform X3 [Daphnia pulicaria]|uniref:solute carrier family 2, facilitated glucose transporter member 8-like isoform X3 n=2 Tax=Daphnia pulicaria TaxID=35523 RepID=UPI001EEBF1AA|nr:solute carrier family 2, facilitated glucose transporter member 8-like isoform X3 [Daphnia pulicaria]
MNHNRAMEEVNSAFVGDDGQLEDIGGPVTSPKTPSVKHEIDYSTATKRPQIGAALAAAFSAFLLGTTLGWSSPVQPQLQHISTGSFYPNDTQLANIWHIDLDDDQMSWVGSLLNIGAMIGALSGGFLMDKFGRRFVLMVMTAPYIIGWLMISLAVDSNMLYVGRVVVGFSGGVCTAIAPCYIGEISTPAMRGIVGFFFSVNLASGLLVTSVMGLWMHWRWLSVICTIEPIIFLVGMICVPESPYFLMRKGKQSEALEALVWLRGSTYNIKAELHQIETRVLEDSKETCKISDVCQPWVFKPVLIGVVLMLLQQFSGLNALSFNAAEIFRLANFSFDRLIGVVLINVAQVSAVVLSSVVLVKRLNRRTLFIISEGIAGLSMLLMGVYFHYSGRPHSQEMVNFKWIPLTAMIVFFAAIGLGLGALPWLISSEILPPRFRGPGSSIVAFTNFAMSFTVTKTFVDMNRVMTHAGVFWFYSGACCLGIMFGLFLLPETKDRTPLQIQVYFRSRVKRISSLPILTPK